jgi:anthranilate phosphoribosyltransferase
MHKVLTESLSQAEAKALMERIMAGQLTPVQLAAVLLALRTRGETLDEIVGFALGMREAAIAVEVSKPVLDLVGTGGVAPELFNISTTACFVVAAGGVAVAKHGNRAASSQSGSFDLLEALGIRIDLPADKTAEAIERFGLGFLFARTHHPAMRFVAPVRTELGIRTVFNWLGPLTNPAAAQFSVLGVGSPTLLETFAQALTRLGISRALVVHGSLEEPIDELVPGRNHITEVSPAGLTHYTLEAQEVGLTPTTYQALKGGSAAENATLATAILGGAVGPKSDAVALSAGAAFYISGKSESIQEGVTYAQAILESGEALDLLRRLAEFSQQA